MSRFKVVEYEGADAGEVLITLLTGLVVEGEAEVHSVVSKHPVGFMPNPPDESEEQEEEDDKDAEDAC